MECPVCLSDTHPRDVLYPFDCAYETTHGVCDSCAREMCTRGMKTCPVCRAPAVGTVENSIGRVLMGAVQHQTDHVRTLLRFLPVDSETNTMLNETQEVVTLARALFNQPSVPPREFQRRLQSLDLVSPR